MLFNQPVFAIEVPEFSDDFNRPDSSDLGSNWYEWTGDFSIASNELYCSAGACGALALSPNTAVDMYASLDYHMTGSERPTIVLRSDATVTNRYHIQFRQYNADILVYRCLTTCGLAGTVAGGVSYSTSDNLKASVQDVAGNVEICGYVNNVLQGCFTDDDVNKITAGNFAGTYNSVTNYSDNFVTGILSTATPTPEPTPEPTIAPTSTPSATLTPSPTSTSSGQLGLQDEVGFQFLGQILAFSIGLIGYSIIASNLYKR